MAKTLLEKMFFKSEYASAFLYVPEDLVKVLDINSKVDTRLQQSHSFILSFYTKKQDLEKDIAQLKKSLLPNSLLWVAYPKGKALHTDLNRDILHKIMEKYQLEGVSLISLNDVWSAMRFKQK